MRINNLYYLKQFCFLLLCHILDFDLNSSGFQKRDFATQQVLIQNFAMCSMVTKKDFSSRELSNMPIKNVSSSAFGNNTEDEVILRLTS